MAIPQAGKHELRIHRSVAMRIEDGLECLRLPVNAMPTARVVVAPREDGRQDAEPVARGGLTVQADNTLIGRMGPADQVEVRWGKPAGAALISPRELSKVCYYGTSHRPAIESGPGSPLISRETIQRSASRTRRA